MWTSSTRSIRWRGNHCQCWNSRKKTTNETVIEAADVSLQDDWRNKQKDLERSPTPSRPAKQKSHTTSGTKKNNKSRNVDPSPNPITGREPITKSFFSRLPAFFFSLLALSFFSYLIDGFPLPLPFTFRSKWLDDQTPSDRDDGEGKKKWTRT